jgi:hypothetical protein
MAENPKNQPVVLVEGLEVRNPNWEWAKGELTVKRAKVRDGVFVFHCYVGTKYSAQCQDAEAASAWAKKHLD